MVGCWRLLFRVWDMDFCSFAIASSRMRPKFLIFESQTWLPIVVRHQITSSGKKPPIYESFFIGLLFIFTTLFFFYFLFNFFLLFPSIFSSSLFSFGFRSLVLSCVIFWCFCRHNRQAWCWNNNSHKGDREETKNKMKRRKWRLKHVIVVFKRYFSPLELNMMLKGTIGK